MSLHMARYQAQTKASAYKPCFCEQNAHKKTQRRETVVEHSHVPVFDGFRWICVYSVLPGANSSLCLIILMSGWNFAWRRRLGNHLFEPYVHPFCSYGPLHGTLPGIKMSQCLQPMFLRPNVPKKVCTAYISYIYMHTHICMFLNINTNIYI